MDRGSHQLDEFWDEYVFLDFLVKVFPYVCRNGQNLCVHYQRQDALKVLDCLGVGTHTMDLPRAVAPKPVLNCSLDSVP